MSNPAASPLEESRDFGFRGRKNGRFSVFPHEKGWGQAVKAGKKQLCRKDPNNKTTKEGTRKVTNKEQRKRDWQQRANPGPNRVVNLPYSGFVTGLGLSPDVFAGDPERKTIMRADSDAAPAKKWSLS